MAAATAQFQCTPHNSRFSTNFHAPGSPQDTSPQSSNWHFPGPSSRFNQRERASTHSRAGSIQSATTVLHTERRAHRRAHSSYHIPTVTKHDDRAVLRKSLNARFVSPTSPSSSEPTRSPLSRFPSFTMAATNGVVTPAKTRDARSNARLHDSPFSDYFTDDNRSIDEVASQTLPALETQQLLVRLNKLQSTLMRGGNDSQALYLVGRRMSEIENDMDSLHSQSRQPPELDDSGLFMEEADEDERYNTKRNMRRAHFTSFDGAADVNSLSQSYVEVDSDSKVALKQAHEVLKTVAMAHKALQSRFEEFKKLREQYQEDLRKKDAELQALRTEKQHMQQDLNLDHGDFVLLDGQLRLLENRITHNTTDDNLTVINALRADCRKAIENVNSKRVRYSDSRTRSNEQYDEDLKTGSWKMNVVRHPTGRVDSMLLERISVEEGPRFEITEVSAKTIERRSKVLYADQGSQVDSTPLEPVESVQDYESSEEEFDPRDELRQGALADELFGSECAITTSPPSEYDGSTNDNEEMNGKKDIAETTTKAKSAWYELWNGMAELAGVGEHRWS